MKAIPFQYRQLLVSASDAGLNKIGLLSDTREFYSVRLLPVTTASPARKGCYFERSIARPFPSGISVRRGSATRVGRQKSDAAYNARMAALYREAVLKEKPVQSENEFISLDSPVKNNGNGHEAPLAKQEVEKTVAGDSLLVPSKNIKAAARQPLIF